MIPREWAHTRIERIPLRRRLVNAACYLVAATFPRVNFPMWLLERAARHHFGKELGP